MVGRAAYLISCSEQLTLPLACGPGSCNQDSLDLLGLLVGGSLMLACSCALCRVPSAGLSVRCRASVSHKIARLRKTDVTSISGHTQAGHRPQHPVWPDQAGHTHTFIVIYNIIFMTATGLLDGQLDAMTDWMTSSPLCGQCPACAHAA